MAAKKAKKKARKKGRKKAAGGRPRSVLTKEAEAKILATVKLVYSLGTAAQVHGISADAARQHKKRNPKFVTLLEQARATSKQGLVAQMLVHSKKHWRASAWLLERLWPDEFGPQMPDAAAANVTVVHVGEQAREDLRGMLRNPRNVTAMLDELDESLRRN